MNSNQQRKKRKTTVHNDDYYDDYSDYLLDLFYDQFRTVSFRLVTLAGSSFVAAIALASFRSMSIYLSNWKNVNKIAEYDMWIKSGTNTNTI